VHFTPLRPGATSHLPTLAFRIVPIRAFLNQVVWPPPAYAPTFRGAEVSYLQAKKQEPPFPGPFGSFGCCQSNSLNYLPPPDPRRAPEERFEPRRSLPTHMLPSSVLDHEGELVFSLFSAFRDLQSGVRFSLLFFAEPQCDSEPPLVRFPPPARAEHTKSMRNMAHFPSVIICPPNDATLPQGRRQFNGTWTTALYVRKDISAIHLVARPGPYPRRFPSPPPLALPAPIPLLTRTLFPTPFNNLRLSISCLTRLVFSYHPTPLAIFFFSS